MHRQPFIPARNSRHRIAALSLYRALLRSTGKIAAAQDAQSPASRDAMTRAVKKAFIKNRADTSFRLVYASMVAGYKFLTLFSKAIKPGCPEHTQLMAHLRSRGDLTPFQAKPKHAVQRPRDPFLKRVATHDDGQPVYKPTYIPHTFKYRIPSVSATADGQPFIRLKKPQPKWLSRMIGRKGRIFCKKIRKLVQVDEELGWDAAQEDRWDELVARQMRAERVSSEEAGRFVANGSSQQVSESSFAWSVQLTRLWWDWQVERTWRDWNARGEALHQVVEEQRMKMSREDGVALESCLGRPFKDGKMPDSRDLDTPNVDVYPGPHYPLAASISPILARQMVGQQRPGTGDSVDPFTGPAWNALVRAQNRRLMKWAGKGTAV